MRRCPKDRFRQVGGGWTQGILGVGNLAIWLQRLLHAEKNTGGAYNDGSSNSSSSSSSSSSGGGGTSRMALWRHVLTGRPFEGGGLWFIFLLSWPSNAEEKKSSWD